jgi:hypothetical protein
MIGRVGATVGRRAHLCTLRSSLLFGLMGAVLLRCIVFDATTVLTYTMDFGSKAGSPTVGRRSITVTTTSSSDRGVAVLDDEIHSAVHDRGAPAGSVSEGIRTGGQARQPAVPRRNVEWLAHSADFPDGNVYSACWYMNVGTFLQVDTGYDSVFSREAAVFAAFRGREHLIRMSLDYLDLSVEHLSFWWRMMGAPRDVEANKFAVDAYSMYIARHVHQQLPFPYRLQSNPVHVTKPLHPTVAVIAFGQRKVKEVASPLAERAYKLTITSLGVTVASLVQLGVGRIVVVGSDPSDESVVQDSFQLLKSAENLDRVHLHEGTITQVYDTQLIFVLVQGDLLKSSYENNIPRATLTGLQKALQESDPDWTRRWLGEQPQYWKYVYYTEADSILQTRPSMIPHLKRQLDYGLILNPHRFQVIAYDGDLPGRDKVPVEFKTPITLNSDEIVAYHGGDDTAKSGPGVFQHCCGSPDASYRPGSNRPGISKFPRCGKAWYKCGFDGGRNHSRLEPYDFIVLSHGTGMTTIAATEQARRCIPSTVPCRRGASSTEKKG